MRHTHRWLIPAAAWLSLAAAGCAPPGDALTRRIDAALARAGRFLTARQSPDGTWRSDTYGAFKTGPALTSHVMSSLFFIPQAGPDARQAFDRGVGYLVSFVGPDGRLNVAERELLYPAFDAASASRGIVLAEPGWRISAPAN